MAKCTMYDTLGKEVLLANKIIESNQIELSTSNLTSGIYTLVITADNAIFNSKVIVQ
jgi:hypothetical protein